MYDLMRKSYFRNQLILTLVLEELPSCGYLHLNFQAVSFSNENISHSWQIPWQILI